MEKTRRELPHVAARSGLAAVDLSFNPDIHRVIGIFLGFGRSYPPEILDEELLVNIKQTIDALGVEGAGKFWRENTPRRHRAECRAVLMNLSRMRRENGGLLPWEN